MSIPSSEQILRVLDELDSAIADDLETQFLDFKPWRESKQEMRVAVEYAVCFANAEGGAVVFGVADKTRGRAAAIHGVRGYDLDTWKRGIFDATGPNLAVRVEELAVPEGTGTLLVVRVPKGFDPPYGTAQGVYKRRIGKNCMPLDPRGFIRAQIQSGAIDWSDQTAQGVSRDDLDPVEIARARNVLSGLDAKSELLKLNDSAFLTALGALRGGQVTHAGLLLFGREAVLRERCPQSQVHYVYQVSDTEVARNDFHRCGLLQALERIETIFSGPVNPEQELSVGFFKLRIPAFPIEVVREAMLNALTHRDYSDPGEVVIRHTAGELVVVSPGGFLGGITPQNILKHEPATRNRTLAEAFQKLRLVEKAGIGRRRIFMPLLEYGKQMPRYELQGDRVVLRIVNGTIDRHLARWIARWKKDGRSLDLDALLILNHLRRNPSVDSGTTAELLQIPPGEAQTLLDRLAQPGEGFLERRGETERVSFHLIPGVGMVRSKIFVSYSHRDATALEQLLRFLRPLERDGLIEVWEDTRLVVGDEWTTEFDQALAEAAVAVLLISQHFLDSEFIARREVPAILAAADAGELTVIPVFLTSSTVEEVEYDVAGEQRRIKLTQYQGFGTPSRPLSELSWAARERVYSKLTKQLRALTGEPAAGEELRRNAKREVPRLIDGPARTYVLTVDLEHRGEELCVRYFLSGSEPLFSASLPWIEFAPRFESLSRSLDQGRIQSDAGEVLFDVLFGSPERWEPILRQLFDQPPPGPRPNPPRAPVRVRIATADAKLLALPWRLTAWNGRPLCGYGWIFTTTHAVDPASDLATTAPASVLIVAPEDEEHPAALVELLNRVWPTAREAGYVRVVKTRAELRNALRGMRPHVVYVYARERMESGRPSLVLGETTVDLAELLREASHRPDVVYLNTAGLTEPDPLLLTRVPLVVWRRLPEWQPDSTTRALAWFRGWLKGGGDPVESLHEITRADLSSNIEAATLAVHSSYRTWRTATGQGFDRERLPRLRLDRDYPKALVRKHVVELARSDTWRVMALVAYAAPGNSVAILAEQLRDYLEGEVATVAAINWLQIEFPADRTELRHGLENELRRQLRADVNEPVPHLLRRHAPTPGSPERAIIWLNWGTFGGSRQNALTSAQLGDWLRFSSELLANQCPDDVRLVSYLAIETPAAKHSRLSQTLQEQRRQPWSRNPAFRLSVLPPLGSVSEEDLLDFLYDPRNSSCDPAIRVEVSERLVARTGGEFESTIALMEEAERSSWYDLLSRLRREQGAEQPADEELL